MREAETKWEQREEREGAGYHGCKSRRKDRWRLEKEREKERLTIARRQVARSPLAADKVNFL